MLKVYLALVLLLTSLPAVFGSGPGSEGSPKAPPYADLQQRLDQIEKEVAAVTDPAQKNNARIHQEAAQMFLQLSEEASRCNANPADIQTLFQAAQEQSVAAESALQGKGKAERLPLESRCGEYHAILNHEVGFIFKIAPQLAQLKAVYHPRKKQHFLRWRLGAQPLWELQFYKAPGQWFEQVNSTMPAEIKSESKCEKDGLKLTLVWQNQTPSYRVVLDVRLAADAQLAHWQLKVENREKERGVWNVVFPIIRGLGKDRDDLEDFLAVPQKSGFLYFNPTRTADISADVAMQFLCYYFRNQAGLYIQADDPGGSKKELTALRDSGTLATAFDYLAPYAGIPGHNYTFGARIGAFTGDWYDGAVLYRQWALQQNWAPKEPLWRRKDVPEKFKNTHLSVRSDCASTTPAKELERVRKLKDILQTPAVILWYNWYHSKTGMELLPDMRPLEGFPQAVDGMNSAGMLTGGYLCDRLWDTASESYQRENGEDAAKRDEYGNVFYNRWSECVHIGTCPASAKWKKRMESALTTMVKDYGVKGVYNDLAGTWSGNLCFSQEHGHPPGGGSWYAEASRKLIGDLRSAARKRDPDFVMCVEGNDERILSVIDSYTSFQGFDPAYQINIPMFQVVYGDYVHPYGCKSSGWGNAPLEGYNLAEQFAWGGMIGRYWTVSAEQPDLRLQEWVRSLIAYREAAKAWLVFGQMLRPPKPTIQPAPATRFDEYGLVLSAAYKAPDGSIGLVFASSRVSNQATFSFAVQPQEYGIPTDGSWAIYRLSPTGQLTKIESLTATWSYTETVEPLKVSFFVIKPEGGKS